MTTFTKLRNYFATELEGVGTSLGGWRAWAIVVAVAVVAPATASFFTGPF